jgi:hypothetical protein
MEGKKVCTYGEEVITIFSLHERMDFPCCKGLLYIQEGAVLNQTHLCVEVFDNRIDSCIQLSDVSEARDKMRREEEGRT